MEGKKICLPHLPHIGRSYNIPLISFLKPLSWTKSKSHATEGKAGLCSDFSPSLLYASFGRRGGCWSVTSLPLPLWSSYLSSSRTLWRVGHVSLLELLHPLQSNDTEKRGQESQGTQNPRGCQVPTNQMAVSL